MHSQPNIHYLRPDFSRFSLVNKRLRRSKGAKIEAEEDRARAKEPRLGLMKTGLGQSKWD